jgi:hypothetical protein
MSSINNSAVGLGLSSGGHSTVGGGSGSSSASSSDDRTKTLMVLQTECWKHFIDRGMFDTSYALRVKSSFRYLCGADASHFTLRDFADKGKLVIPYLCINLSNSETNFAIMDIFRRFDKSATGKIFIDDFVVGIIVCLNRCNTDETFLKPIVQELMPSGACMAGALHALLSTENQQSIQRNTLYHQYFSAIDHIVKQQFDLYLMKEKENILSGNAGAVMPWAVDLFSLSVDESVFAKILKDSIQSAVCELQEQFHTPWMRIRSALADHGNMTNENSFASVGLGQSGLKPVWVVRSHGSRIELGAQPGASAVYPSSQKLSSFAANKKKSLNGGIAGFQDIAMNTPLNAVGQRMLGHFEICTFTFVVI